MNKNKKYNNYEELLHDELKNPKLAEAYLNEALADKDQRVFLIALKDVIDAQGENISTLAQETHISRQSLYRMLSSEGNPRWNSLSALLGTLGYQVQLSFKKI